jgi:mucin-19
MAITVKHKFVSAIPDGTDDTIVRPSNWNDDHDLTGTIPVENGGTGASTLTGYVKGNGTAAMTASATVPSTDITGLGTMSAQDANNVAITGGSISGTTVGGYVPTTTTITAGTGLTGGGDLSANRTLDIANTTVTAASYGSASKTLTATVNAQGQLTALADTNIAITNTQVSGLGTASTKDAGAALGVATLDAGGKVPQSQIPLMGDLNYQGTWNATTNTPTLTSSVGTKGYYYVVDVAGTTNLNGITDWQIGDWAIFNGTVWQKVDNTDAVTSVNGATGTVVLTTTNIAEGTNEYFTTARARTSISAGTGISYDNSTGVVTNAAPDQTVVLTDGTAIDVTGTYPNFTINNTAPDQTVVLTAGTGISTSGTYPNFTITNTSPSAGGDVVGPASATDNAIARFDTTTGKLIQNSTVTVSDAGVVDGVTHMNDVDYIDFDTTYATTLAAGQLGWNGNDTLGLGMIGGNVIQHIGEDQFFYAKATATITKGQVVMFTGAVGASGVPTGAPATGITNGTYIMGIAAENIANNGFGLVQSFGTLRNVNTTGYADGDILWYNPAVTGGLTKTKPVAPNVKAQMAAVINGGSAGGGTILIRISAGSTLGGTDSNAEIVTPSNGQIITYDGLDGYWKNTDLTAGTAISVAESSTGVLTINNTGVTSAVAGTGISVSGATGAVTVTNTAPDQTVVLTAGTGISTSGTYPNFTVTNTAPDQTVAITGAGGAVVTGTYPNFTVTTPSGTVTSVSGTAPIASSGGATPAISISQASGSTDGYLSSTDWTTFNNKSNTTGTVTSVGGTGTVNGISLSGTVTSSGNLTLGGTLSGVSLTTQVSGTLPIANGGTGETTRQAAMDTLAGAVTSGQYLRGNGTDVVMSAIQAADVPTLNQNTTGTAANVTGTVAIANGGTGQTTATAAFNALNPMTTTGDIIYEASSSVAARLGIGSTGQVLTVSGGLPTWQNAGAGSITPTAVSDQANTATGYFDIPSGTTAQRPVSPSSGMIRYNTTTSQYEAYLGTDWLIMSTTGYSYTAEYLVVAGGGGGGDNGGGGGAAGGLLSSSLTVSPGTPYTVTVGAGGAPSTSGNNSVFSTFTASAGGRGGNLQTAGTSGGSGGGGGTSYFGAGAPAGGAGTAGQGNNGGDGAGGIPTVPSQIAGGGGGGQSSVGSAGTNSNGGAGGTGLNWFSIGNFYAGGGGGGSGTTGAAGGSGVGGNGGSGGTSATNGTANRGGGGGGGGNPATTGGSGGSGVVIIRYAGSQRGTGGTVTSSGGFTYHTFTSSGTYTS